MVNQAKGRYLIMALNTSKANLDLYPLYIRTLQEITIQFNKIHVINYYNGDLDTQLVLKKEDCNLLFIDSNICDTLIL
ncbi:MAG: hypothetical protein ACRC0A_05310 [Chitinophagaceae bacterium]